MTLPGRKLPAQTAVKEIKKRLPMPALSLIPAEGKDEEAGKVCVMGVEVEKVEEVAAIAADAVKSTSQSAFLMIFLFQIKKIMRTPG